MPHHIHRAATKTRIDAAPNEIERHMDDAHEFVNCVKLASIVRQRISLSKAPRKPLFPSQAYSVNNVFSVGIKKSESGKHYSPSSLLGEQESLLGQ